MAILRASVRQWTDRRLRSLACIGLVLSALQFAGGRDLPGQTEASPEYRIKAAFLFNFAQFVEWPPAAFPEKQTPLIIGILGDDPFKGFLDEFVRDEKVGSRPLRIEYYRRVEEIKECHILFISSTEAKRLEQILDKLKNRSVLTVGESEDFAAGGGMIRFVTENKKIRLRINTEAAAAANLTISSKLLRLAEILPPPKR